MKTDRRVLLVAGAVFSLTLAGPTVEAALPEICGAGVSCMGAGLTRICTISVSPATTPSMVHFVGQQNSYASNANAICQQGGVTNTFTGTMQGVNNGTNTSMFPIYLRAQRNPTASAPSPACVFVFKTSAYSETALCTISVADGLPVELMDFGIEEEDGAAAHGTETTAREGSEDSK